MHTVEKPVLSVRNYMQELFSTGSIKDYVIVEYKEQNLRDPSEIGFYTPTLIPRRTIVENVHIVRREKKFSIAIKTKCKVDTHTAHIHHSEDFFGYKLIYLPNNIDHAEIFAESSAIGGGPKEEAPGSVAVLYLWQQKRHIGGRALQYCFKQGSTKKLTRSLTSKYMGAHKRLVETLFELNTVKNADSIDLEFPISRPKKDRELEKILKELEPTIPFKVNGRELERK